MTGNSHEEAIKEGLIEIIRPYLPEELSSVEVDQGSHFIRDLKINSAYLVDIVLDIEDRYNLIIEDEVIGKMNTIQDSIDLIFKQSLDYVSETT